LLRALALADVDRGHGASLGEHFRCQRLHPPLGVEPRLLLHHPADPDPVLELDRLHHVEQRHPAPGVLGAPAGETECVVHLLALVDDDEEHPLRHRRAGRRANASAVSGLVVIDGRIAVHVLHRITAS
jgi:hypothetical protein